MFPILETDRITLRELTDTDVYDIFACLSNKEVIRFYGSEPLNSAKEAKELVEFFKKNYNEERGIRWGIERKGTKGIIGTIGYHAWSQKHKRAEIGYEIHPEYWRKGYTSEAISKVISFGFDTMGLTRIGAIVFLENEASNKLLEKVGFQKEGILRGYIYQQGKAYDTNVYSLLKR
ncbi:GNAT family N-acetyltransferase [Rummeliibacillus stabekisii]|uniref:GNAT family N-acetyltransferase n=1 Tax=Rummeliibacillus stabekisii TaxID=241244 RepID=UPI00116CD19B|nr:GNAT family protein [Rummeliibacillus stabekisii]MBB5169563.1 ribosomal-protein-alanine N-acetyltransferase [Rummeliibacillus stabekisii]GEL03821.1 putative N-acetyltransferase YoaA [Rummeliibacillus stabekisii]